MTMVAEEEQEEPEDESMSKDLEPSPLFPDNIKRSSSWLQHLKNGGPVNLVDVGDDFTAGWSSPPGNCFQVRGQDYMMNKIKVAGGDSLLEPVAFDWLKSNIGRIDEVLRDPNNRVMSGVAEALKKGNLISEPFVLAINLQVPSKNHYSLVAYYMSKTPFSKDSLVDRFMKGDDEFRNSRLKLIANIVRGPWAVKTAVGDHAICLLGKSLTCRYIQGENYLEMDVDIGSSMMASTIVHLAINYITSLTVDLAFLIEGRTKEELPERLLGSVRFTNLELSTAVSIEISPNPIVHVNVSSTSEIGAPMEPKEERGDHEDSNSEEELEDTIIEEEILEESFQFRVWKSIGQGLSIDWWARQQL